MKKDNRYCFIVPGLLLLVAFLLVRESEAKNSFATTEDSVAHVENPYGLEQLILGNATDGDPYVFEGAPDEEIVRMKAPPSALKLAQDAGYDLETYRTTTADGYHLVVHRLMNRTFFNEGDGNTQEKPVVLLQHGIVQSSADWLINESGKSLAMLLVDHGYDVWLGNSRGNKYSNRHVTRDEETMEFFNFTFHEMGTLDLPKTIDLILEQTKQPQISYIGASLGATIFFTTMSTHPEYANRIQFMGAISPQVFLSHTKTPLRLLAPHLTEIKERAVSLNVMRINPETLPVLINSQLGKLCWWRKLSKSLCNSIYQMLDAFGFRRIENKHLEDMWKYIPTTTSARTCIHVLQLMNNQGGLFDEYDYGPDGNSKMYGTPVPPEYDLTEVKVPVALFTGEEEIFSTSEDVDALKRALPYVVHHVVVDSSYRVHTDFMQNGKALEQIFKPIVYMLNHYNARKPSWPIRSTIIGKP